VYEARALAARRADYRRIGYYAAPQARAADELPSTADTLEEVIVTPGRRAERALDVQPGPASNAPLAPTETARIARTVARAPEVVVKVSGGATSLRAALAHVRYVSSSARVLHETLIAA
jgi:hypothetical protein